MSLLRTIAQLAPHHSALTTELTQLDNLAEQLTTTELEIARLRNVVVNEEIDLPRARASLVREWREHVNSQMSVADKLREKLSGPSTQAQDEVKMRSYPEYASALSRLNERKGHMPRYELELETLTNDADSLRQRISRREQLFRDLDDMYKLVFDGRTPEAPEEDLLEWQLRSAESLAAHLGPSDEPERALLAQLDVLLPPMRELESRTRDIRDQSKSYAKDLTIDQSHARNVAIARYLGSLIVPHLDALNKALRAQFTRETAALFSTSSSNVNPETHPRAAAFVSVPPIELMRTYGTGGNFMYFHSFFGGAGPSSNGGIKEKDTKLDHLLPSNDTQEHHKKFADGAVKTLRALEYEQKRARARAMRVQNDIVQAKATLSTLRLQLHSMRRRLFERFAQEVARNPANADTEVGTVSFPAPLHTIDMPQNQASHDLPPEYNAN